MNRTPLNRRGKKTRAWERVRRDLKEACERAGVTSCEIRGEGCMGNQFLGFAHSRKRRNITTDEQLREACLACQRCHSAIELLPEDMMGDIVRDALSNRL